MSQKFHACYDRLVPTNNLPFYLGRMMYFTYKDVRGY